MVRYTADATGGMTLSDPYTILSFQNEAAVVPDVVRSAAKHGVDCLIMSLGGLMLNPDLFNVARQGSMLICMPSGAICAVEKNLPVRIARLAQTFGAGVSKSDNRVFAQFSS